jgi:hypothetical protein
MDIVEIQDRIYDGVQFRFRDIAYVLGDTMIFCLRDKLWKEAGFV